MKPIILVADSGSSKTDWRLSTEDGIKPFSTQGLNPYIFTEKEMVKMLETQGAGFIEKAAGVSEVYFFGAGCSSPDKRETVSNALSAFFPQAFITVESDILASAYATCGDKPGLTCVLGTGSNISYFDGENVHPGNFGLGYVLGDEGSGVALGKRLITDFLYERMPQYIHGLFQERYALNKEMVIKHIYQKPAANTYIASFGQFLSQVRKSDYAQKVLSENFEEFITTNILSYTQYKKLPVHFVGSIAWHFADELKARCEKHQVQVGVIIKKPIDKLFEHVYKQAIAG